MSTWTHVVGAIRFDGIPRTSIETFQFEAINAIMRGELKVDDKGVLRPLISRRKLPTGSEGPIQYTLHQYGNGLPWIVIPIWGDLRDYDNVTEIKDWFFDLCQRYPLVRDAVLRIQVEDREPIVIQYDLEKSV